MSLKPPLFYAQARSGSEMRNINRTNPGVKDGAMTEQISYAITNMFNTLDIDMEVDLHEASPEYPTINATVAHERAMSITSMWRPQRRMPIHGWTRTAR